MGRVMRVHRIKVVVLIQFVNIRGVSKVENMNEY